MTEPDPKADELALIYDGECPVCTAYSCSVDVDQAKASGIKRINARSDDALVRKAKEAGVDLDEGMVVLHEGRLYHGADALNIMARPGLPKLDELKKLGVKRMSAATSPYTIAMAALIESTEEFLAKGDAEALWARRGTPPDYNKLFG